jgi:1,4-dihydroxy-2-naphthoate octaprenyltransferase
VFAAIAAIVFAVLLVLDVIAGAGAGAILLDIGLLCLALALAFGPNFPITLRGPGHA